MPTIYISKQTKILLEKLKQQYILEKHISPTVVHIITADVIIQEMYDTVRKM